jgi:hypothetical protein
VARKQRLILRHKFALGDTVLFTALARDIELAHPGRFEIVVDSHQREVWDNNPNARTLRDGEATENQWLVPISYRNGIHASGRGERVHMLSWFHRDFSTRTGLHIPVTRPSGDLHLTAAERPPIVPGRYWVLMAGGKLDITAKWWWAGRYQTVVDALARLGITCVQAGANFAEHRHPTLTGVVNLVGKYPSARDFFRLIRDADGVIGPVTAAMHIAACFDKPCVVLNGGREEPWWEAYVNTYKAFGPAAQPVKVEHRFLHTLGQLECCQTKGCWRHRTVKLGIKDRFDGPKAVCKLPVIKGEDAVPKCLDLIEPDHVIEAVMSYYERGEIPPIGKPSRKYSFGGQNWDVTIKKDMPGIPTEPVYFTDPFPKDPPAAISIPNATTPTSRMIGDPNAKARVIQLPGFTKGITAADAIQKTDLESKKHAVCPKCGGQLRDDPNVIQRCDCGWRMLREDNFYRRILPPPAITNDELDRSVFTNPPTPLQIDHPLIGGKFTVCVLCYGPHYELAKRCIDSIRESLPARCLDLRVGLNAVEPRTKQYVASIPGVTVYDHPENAKKYPVMREMFHDPAKPITTKYVVWLDDDAKVVDPMAWSRLCEAIVANHPQGARLYGNTFIHDAGTDGLPWFRQSRWWRGRNLRVKGRAIEANNGTVVEFVSGWFWAMSTDLIQSADIPCPRINHNGGDITIGAQVHQAGFKIKQLNKDKALVWCPPREAGGRRGYSEGFPWQQKT